MALAAPQSRWQKPFVKRLIGSIRRECLNHVLVLSEQHLRRILARYLVYYHQTRTHLALEKDAPDVRPIALPAIGKIVQLPEVVVYRRYICQAGSSIFRRPPRSWLTAHIRWIGAPAAVGETR